MLRCPELPLLPGNTFRDITKTKFPRSQEWQIYRNIPMVADKKRQESVASINLYPPGLAPTLPSWINYDKKILCFGAFFKENLQEVYRASYQIRKVKIMLHLENGDIQIMEPKVINSGIPQGCILSRQKVPKNTIHDKEFISVLDLNVNKTIRIFDRIYHITGCDIFTRNYLNRLGISVPDPTDTPSDPSTEMRRRALSAMQPRKPSVKVDTLGQFLKNDRKVLRFGALWDDRSTMFGDLRKLIVLYYLADDTIEIIETFPTNSGRDGNSTFLKRMKLPKTFQGKPQLGEQEPFTVLNVLGGSLKGGRYLTDALCVGDQKVEYYKDKDLVIGETINVFSRKIVLTDCDVFTQNYYQTKYGIEEFTYNPAIKNGSGAKSQLPQERELPPFNGWGTHEDSEGNCMTVEPKAPKIDIKKIIKLDKHILRFGAKMISRILENNERVFVISYYLADDTISIFELPLRNSGFLGGEFFHRGKIYLPNQNWLSNKRPQHYIPQHFYIGATVTLNDHIFHIVSADEFVFSYMEQNSNTFPYSNVDEIISKIREALRPKYKNFVAKYLDKLSYTITSTGSNVTLACFDMIRNFLDELLGSQIVEHEIITICRYFSVEKLSTSCNRNFIRAVCQGEIIRNLWNDIDRLREHLYHLDPESNGFMTPTKVLTAIRAVRLPFKIELIENLFDVLNKNHKGCIDINDFINVIDFTKSPEQPVPPVNTRRDVCPIIQFSRSGKSIDWNAFIAEIGLEEILKQETD